MNIQKLKEKILQKKELQSLDNQYIEKFVEEYKEEEKEKYKKLEDKKFNERSTEFKDMQKWIRKRLREVYGVFSKKNLTDNQKQKLLDELYKAVEEKNVVIENDILIQILRNHLSTYERLPYYPRLYSEIAQQTGMPKSIMDLGCGFNPFAINYLPSISDYFATDISQKDMDFIQKYFDIEKIKGEAIQADLTNENDMNIILDKSKNYDWCLCFKLLDSLESTKKGTSEKLILGLQTKTIVVSFPTKTISGKGEIKGERKWFLNIIQKKQSQKYAITKKMIGSEEYTIFTKN